MYYSAELLTSIPFQDLEAPRMICVSVYGVQTSTLSPLDTAFPFSPLMGDRGE